MTCLEMKKIMRATRHTATNLTNDVKLKYAVVYSKQPLKYET